MVVVFSWLCVYSLGLYGIYLFAYCGFLSLVCVYFFELNGVMLFVLCCEMCIVLLFICIGL
jgi:hypothetical protein